MGEMQIILDADDNLFLVVTDKADRVIGVFGNCDKRDFRPGGCLSMYGEFFGVLFMSLLLNGTAAILGFLPTNRRFFEAPYVFYPGYKPPLETQGEGLDKLENWFSIETSVKQDCCRVLLKVKIADNLSRAELATALKHIRQVERYLR